MRVSVVDWGGLVPKGRAKARHQKRASPATNSQRCTRERSTQTVLEREVGRSKNCAEKKESWKLEEVVLATSVATLLPCFVCAKATDTKTLT